ncbi:hypothetical protein L1987_57670 [Smallanthus sonchifolius]|uniref:Uncharacterized protein n=1 Tax=Smallanthus sonchifolius TaxID=185202 RepID=A0ACB9DDN1_9ASTR|nr:hypothetical protein L1987_57670 [Smallanthus sonchifolius]
MSGGHYSFRWHMNFSSTRQQTQQIGQIGNSRMGQTGHLTMPPCQDAAAQLNLKSQLLASPRQKTRLVQGSQFHPANTPGQL